MTIDLSSVKAIDVHVHAEVGRAGEDGLRPEWRQAAAAYFGDHALPTVDDVAAYYRERKLAAVVFTVDAETVTGRRAVPNEEIAEAARREPRRPDPVRVDRSEQGRAGGRRGAAADPGLCGSRASSSTPTCRPSTRTTVPSIRCTRSWPRPVCLRSSTVVTRGSGRDSREVAGIRLKYSNPMYVDDVAVDFPELRIVLAHPSFPWQDEAISVALHKQQVFIDLSGWSPKYFPPQLVQYANTLLRDRVLFGSDYPLITPDRWLDDFARADFRDDVRPLILKENAARLLGLTA